VIEKYKYFHKKILDCNVTILQNPYCDWITENKKAPLKRAGLLKFIRKKLFFRYLESDALFVTIDYVSTVLNRSFP
jgi:hypothetical protein